MASNRDVLHWNLESKPFRGRSYLSFILERWCHLFTQFMHAIKKPNDSFHKLVTKQGQCICTRNAKHCNLAATFSKRWKNIGMWYIFKRKVFCLPKPGTDVIPFHLGVIFFNSVFLHILPKAWVTSSKLALETRHQVLISFDAFSGHWLQLFCWSSLFYSQPEAVISVGF